MIELELKKDFVEFCNIPRALKRIDNQIERISLISINISAREAVSRILLLMKAKDNLILKYQIMKKIFLKLPEDIIEILKLIQSEKTISEISKYFEVSTSAVKCKLNTGNKIYRRIKNGKI